MIKLTKGPMPKILADSCKTWTEELQRAIRDHDEIKIKSTKKRYNHPEIKTALKTETHEKCAYCEAKVTDVAHGDIEHITPKSLDPSLTFDWSNLTFSCQICNQHKSDKEDILDPYAAIPDEHLFFAGPFIKGKSTLGSRTVRELDLNRAPLIESRNREIERFANEIEKSFIIADMGLKKLIQDSLITELETKRPEFTSACRAAILALIKQ